MYIIGPINYGPPLHNDGVCRPSTVVCEKKPSAACIVLSLSISLRISHDLYVDRADPCKQEKNVNTTYRFLPLCFAIYLACIL